jgi:hypothetical protein
MTASRGFIGCAFAMARELYDKLHGFDPHMFVWGVEDVDLALRCWLLGHAILHDPEPGRKRGQGGKGVRTIFVDRGCISVAGRAGGW